MADVADEPGAAVVAIQEGSRTFLVEVQALVSPSSRPAPAAVHGGGRGRVSLLAAILEKRAGLELGG